MGLRTRFVAAILFSMPTRLARVLVGMLGIQIDRSARIGFSWIEAPTIQLGPHSSIRHLSVIRVSRLVMEEGTIIGNANWCAGSYSILLSKFAAIGSRNVITRGAVGNEVGSARLAVGEWSKVTSGHRLDVMRTISIGQHTVIAGIGTQIWTHGYVHEFEPRGRYRIDGSVSIGDDCYIGAACVINAGIRIHDRISIGSNATVSKSLERPGLYVSEKLRYLERSTSKPAALRELLSEGLSERVFEKGDVPHD